MEELIFTLNKEVTSVDTDFNLDVKLSTLFSYFQEVSSLHSEVLGVGKGETIDKNMNWIIARFLVEINRMPRYGDKVKIKTYPGSNNKLFFYRHYLITDMKDNVMVRANSVWLVVDATTHQLKRDPFAGYSLPIMKLDDELPNPDKVEGIAVNYLYSRKVRYSDIDLNSHLNNIRYIELIQDSFDLEFYKANRIKSILINYNTEFKAGDEVKVYGSDSNPYIISGKKEDKEHFLAKLDFVKR